MILRFRSGIRVLWATPNRLVVVGSECTEFVDPTIETERVLAALRKGFPDVPLEQQAEMIGVHPETLASVLHELRCHLILAAVEPWRSDHRLRSAERNRIEIQNGITGDALAERRSGWVALLSGADSAVRSIVPLLRSAGIDCKQSTRGWRHDEEDPAVLGWQLSHKLGSVSGRFRQVSIGFFQEEIDPTVYRYWLSRGHLHIAVVFNQFGVKVSRLVRPGLDTCLECDPDFSATAGISRATLHFQTKESPLGFDDARNAAWATQQVVEVLLDWIDHGTTSGKNLSRGTHPSPNANSSRECGCLLDAFEINSFEKSGNGNLPSGGVGAAVGAEEVSACPGNRDVE